MLQSLLYNAISNVLRKTINVGLLEMECDHKHVIVFHTKKSWVENLLPKVSVVERNRLYQRMCQLMHCATKYAFNVMCEEVMQEYSDNPDDWQYIEKEDGHYGFAEYV